MARNVESGLGGEKRCGSLTARMQCMEDRCPCPKLRAVVGSGSRIWTVPSPSSLALASSELKIFFFLTKQSICVAFVCRMPGMESSSDEGQEASACFVSSQRRQRTRVQRV